MATIKILDVEKFIKGLSPVTSTELQTKTGEWSESGLFSEKIFGVEGSLDRQKTFSFINLNAHVMHPIGYRELVGRIDRRAEKFFSTEETFSVGQDGALELDPNGVAGISELIKLFPKILFKAGTADREKIIKLLTTSYKNGVLFINKIPVIPPEFRPTYQDESGQWIQDHLNDIYIKILRQAAQIKSAGTSGALYDLLNYRLQLAINEHDEYIKRKIQKKSGIIRGNLLGKRVDYSGRAVVTPGPQLDINQVGLPLRMTVNLFDPFLKNYLIFSRKFPYKTELEQALKDYGDLELSVDSISRVIKAIKSGDKIPENLRKIMFDACEVVMKDRVVLSKRDPALHDGSYRAFNPVLNDGNTVQLSTTQVTSFNADFDGDAMAFFHPLTNQAQQEAKDKMMKIGGSKSTRDTMFEISKEMAAGLYVMTKPSTSKKSPIAVTPGDIEKATDPYIPVIFRGKRTTMGRAIFNSVFPPDFQFVDKTVTKGIANSLILIVADKYGDDISKKAFSQLAKLGFKFATIVAPTMDLDVFDIPDTIIRLKQKLDGATPDEAQKILKEAEVLLKDHLKGTGLHDLIESGSTKGWTQPMQMLVAKGVIADPKGRLLDPIKGSFADGLTNKEFFNHASGSRKGTIDRSLNTAVTGYFTRQLVYLLSPVEASPTLKDCKTQRAITLRLTSDVIKRLEGRNLIIGNKVVEFDPSKFSVGSAVNLRTPIYCESHKICHTCYGSLLKRHKTPYIGMLAATGIGERGTQLIMRTFHTGGAATIVERNILEDIINNDPLIKVSTSKLRQYIRQDNDSLVALKPCRLTIDLANYKLKDNIQINKDNIWVKSVLTELEFEDLIFKMVLDYSVEIQKLNISKQGGTITISYNARDTILQIPITTDELLSQVNYVSRLVGGKEIYKDPAHLLMKLYKVYQKHSTMDLVHFELLVSQSLRDRKTPEIPARLAKKWDPVMANIKNNVFASGFLQGLAFENINKSIETGLITDQILDQSIMEKLLTGEIVK